MIINAIALATVNKKIDVAAHHDLYLGSTFAVAYLGLAYHSQRPNSLNQRHTQFF